MPLKNVKPRYIINLHNLLDELNITAAELTKRTGVTRPTIDNMLDGGDFKITTLEAVSDALGVSMPSLFKGNTGTHYIANAYQNGHAESGCLNFGMSAMERGLLQQRIKDLEKLVSSKESEIENQKTIIELLKSGKD